MGRGLRRGGGGGGLDQVTSSGASRPAGRVRAGLSFWSGGRARAFARCFFWTKPLWTVDRRFFAGKASGSALALDAWPPPLSQRLGPPSPIAAPPTRRSKSPFIPSAAPATHAMRGGGVRFCGWPRICSLDPLRLSPSLSYPAARRAATQGRPAARREDCMVEEGARVCLGERGRGKRGNAEWRKNDTPSPRSLDR